MQKAKIVYLFIFILKNKPLFLQPFSQLSFSVFKKGYFVLLKFSPAETSRDLLRELGLVKPIFGFREIRAVN